MRQTTSSVNWIEPPSTHPCSTPPCRIQLDLLVLAATIKGLLTLKRVLSFYASIPTVSFYLFHLLENTLLKWIKVHL
jgi:hypothetical protein